MILFFLFTTITLIEIYVLITVGSLIGGGSTILLVITTALIGSVLLRQQGWSTIAKVRNKMTSGQVPEVEIIEGLVILISGILLLTPGFITDIVGLLGLIPFSRAYFIKKIITSTAQNLFTQNKFFQSQPKHNKNNTMEGEFWED